MTTSGVAQTVRLRYWAAAAQAAGTDFDDIEVSGEITLEALIQQATVLHPERKFADVISTCSLLLGDQPVSTNAPDAVTVGPGDCVEFLPPFAGG